MNSKTKGYILGALGAASYGTNPIFAIPLFRDGMDAASVLFFRYLFALPVIALMMQLRGRSFAPRKTSHLMAALLMGILMALSSLLLFVSYDYMGAGVASTLLFLYPIMVALIMCICFKEKAGILTFISILVALAGVFLISFKPGGEIVSLTGTVLVFVSAFSYAVYLVCVNEWQPLKKMPTLKLTFYVILIGAMMFGIMAVAGGGISVPSKPHMWFNIICLAVLPTAFSFYCTTHAITLIGSTPTAILGALEPLTAVALGVVVLAEPITVRIAWGFVLVISGVSLIVAKDSVTHALLRIRKMLPKKNLNSTK
jgi:drug/metabolite transporter (DMT)-like permease